LRRAFAEPGLRLLSDSSRFESARHRIEMNCYFVKPVDEATLCKLLAELVPSDQRVEG